MSPSAGSSSVTAAATSFIGDFAALRAPYSSVDRVHWGNRSEEDLFFFHKNGYSPQTVERDGIDFSFDKFSELTQYCKKTLG